MRQVSFTDPYSAEQMSILRRQKLAEALQQQGMQMPTGTETAPGGWAIKRSPMEGIGKISQQMAGAYLGQKADEDARAFGGKYQEGLMRALREYGEQKAGIPARSEQIVDETGADANAGGPGLAQINIPAKAPNPNVDVMAMASPYPALQQLGTMGYQHALKAADPFNLREGEKRFGPGNVVIADNPKQIQPKEHVIEGKVYQTQPDGTLKPLGGPGKPIDYNKPFLPSGAPNPDYQKYELGKALAGSTRVQTNVNAFTPASEEAQRDFIKSTRTTYDQIKQAPVALESIEKAKALIPGAKGFMGPGGEALLTAAKFLNNRIGTTINTEGVKDAEELRTRIFFNIMDNLKKMDAQPSQQQQMIMQEALGKLGTDPNALPAVLDAFADVMRGKVQLHNTEVQSAINRGVKFPYDPIVKMPSRKSGTPANTSRAPQGIEQRLWDRMSPEDRALWQTP
jgi:hypothetical protein